MTTKNGEFFLTVGTSIELQVTPKTMSQTFLDAENSLNSIKFTILNVGSDIAEIDSNGLLTIKGTESSIVVIPQSLFVLAENGNDWGIGQFAIIDIDTDGDHIVP